MKNLTQSLEIINAATIGGDSREENIFRELRNLIEDITNKYKNPENLSAEKIDMTDIVKKFGYSVDEYRKFFGDTSRSEQDVAVSLAQMLESKGYVNSGNIKNNHQPQPDNQQPSANLRLRLAKAKVRAKMAKLKLMGMGSVDGIGGIDEDFADKLNEFVLKGYTLNNEDEYFSCGYANNILEACGLDRTVEIVITQSGMKKILGQKAGKQDDAHDLTPIEVLRLPQLIQDPILVMQGNTSDSRLVFIEIPRAGRQMFAVINIDRKMKLGKYGRYNLIASVYSQENSKIEEKIKAASATFKIFYYNSEKTKSWLTVNRKLQLFAFISANSMFSEKDFSNTANIEKENETSK